VLPGRYLSDAASFCDVRMAWRARMMWLLSWASTNCDAEGYRLKKTVTPAARREAVAHLRVALRSASRGVFGAWS
jgi:hypothetical protein